MRTIQSQGALRALLLASAASSFAMAFPAFAQNAPTATDAPATVSVDTPAAPAATANDMIVVTGSRIARRDYTATSPIVTVDADLLEQSSAVAIEANLNKLPQFTPALTQFNTQDIQPNANNTIGASTVSLRQLGSNRNLVLLDGRRPTPVNGAGVVDTNSIPSAAVQRVEVITGGASSTYGADAVGGVVNFILKNNYSGLTVDGQFGMSERGDGHEYRMSTLVGANLEGGRGNVMLGMEYYKRDSILQIDRPWYERNLRSTSITGSEFFINSNFVSFPGGTAASPSQAAYNALFRSKGAPATVDVAGTPTNVNIPLSTSVYLNADNSLFINASTRVGPTGGTVYVPLLTGYKGELDGLRAKVGTNGLLSNNNLDTLLSSPQQRWSFFSRGRYELTNDVNFISQAYFARTQTKSVSLNTVAIGSFGVPIPYNNNLYTGNTTLGIASSLLADGKTNPDYLAGGKYGLNCPATGGCTNKQVFPVPAEVAALLDSRPGATALSDWISNTVPTSIARRYTDNNTQTFQVMAGFEGKIPGQDWTWDVSGSYGETVAKTDVYGLFSSEIYRSIMQAPNYGLNFKAVGNNVAPGANRNGATATCATGISPFRSQTYSADCGQAVRIDSQVENRLKQYIAEANLQGGLFKLPYGDLRFALGLSYRKNELRFHSDSSSVEGSTFYETVNGTFPQASTAGAISVKEAYGELLIPVLANLPFAKALNLELGYRISDYSTIGSIGTYKINGEYAPFDWLRFRGGYQKASRAPNLGEVFTAKTQSLVSGADGDPCSRGSTVSPVVYGNYSANPVGANSDLTANPADTVGNPDAAKVEALCRQIMTVDAATQYYRAGRVYGTNQGGAFVSQLLAGAGGLKQETARTYTIGGVLSSPFDAPWMRRLRLSVDYYNVTLSDGISQQGVDSVYRQCFSKLFNPTYALTDICRRIQRDGASGEPSLVTVNFSNLGRVETSGFDIQGDWGVRFKDVGIGVPGTFSLNVNFTYLLKFATTSDQVAIPLVDYAGTSGGGQVGTNAGSYRWKLFTRFNYTVGPATLSLQWQHKPALADSSTVANTNSTIAGAPAYDLFNLSGRYAVTRDVAIRFGIDNLFDKWPPLTAYDTAPVTGALAGGIFNAGNYDTLGRRFFIGASMSF